MQKLLQILVVGFALSLLAVYVVYAQRGQGRRVASETPARIATNGNNASSVTQTTNGRSVSSMVASSSKSIAPVISNPTGLPTSTAPKVLPGSKSAAIFQVQSGPTPPSTNQFSRPSTIRPSPPKP